MNRLCFSSILAILLLLPRSMSAEKKAMQFEDVIRIKTDGKYIAFTAVDPRTPEN